jgi:hypothetical protein
MSDSYLDGAKVLFKARGPFGIGIIGEPVTSLVIARYDDDRPDAIYLFACDANGAVVGDLLYCSVGEAKIDAEGYYGVSPIHWLAAEPNP